MSGAAMYGAMCTDRQSPDIITIIIIRNNMKQNNSKQKTKKKDTIHCKEGDRTRRCKPEKTWYEELYR